jgi:hypothetical protein
MPNLKKFLIFLIETLVESFFVFFGALEDTSSSNSVGWEDILG